MAKVVTGQTWLLVLLSVDSLAVLGGCFVLKGVGREKLKTEWFVVCFVSVESWFLQNGKILKAWNFSGEIKSVSITPSGGHGTCNVSVMLGCVTCYKILRERLICKKQENLNYRLMKSSKICWRPRCLRGCHGPAIGSVCFLRDRCPQRDCTDRSNHSLRSPHFMLVIWREPWLDYFFTSCHWSDRALCRVCRGWALAFSFLFQTWRSARIQCATLWLHWTDLLMSMNIVGQRYLKPEEQTNEL